MNTKIFSALIVSAALSAAMAQADTIQDYQFNGTIAPNTVDTQGLFGVAGANIGGDTFTANIYFDLNIGYTVNNGASGIYYGGGPDRSTNSSGPTLLPTTSPLVASSFIINGHTVAGANGGDAYTIFVPDISFTLSTAAATFTASPGAVDSSFPALFQPGTYVLGCTYSASCIEPVSGGLTFNAGEGTMYTSLNDLVVSDSISAVPVPPAFWLMFSGLGFFALKRCSSISRRGL